MNRRMIFSLSFFLVIGQIHPQQYGGWIRVDSLHFARSDHSSLELPNGNILVTGGYSDQDTSLAECEIFDIVNNYWVGTSSMQIPRYRHHSVLLNNNNVLVIGGFKNKTCEIFDIDSTKWSLTDSTNFHRDGGSTINLLDNNHVLLVGGYYFSEDNSQVFFLDSCEIYDLNLGKWTVTSPLNVVRAYHTATKLLNGNILVTGGHNQIKALRSCELYNVQSGTWSFVDSLNDPRMYHSSNLLPNGKILVAGGKNSDDPQGPWLKSCEVYDPLLNEWTLVNDLSMQRSYHYSILLDNQRILFAGGIFGSETWELYDINTYHSEYIDSFPFTKEIQTANLLKDGRVLSIGGVTWIDTTGLPAVYPTNACEIYDPDLSKLNDYKISEIKKFILKQNYPNPFNSSTIIEYSLNYKSKISLIIYNSIGEELHIVVKEIQEPGSYAYQINSYKLPSGIYIYQLNADGFSESYKMVLIK